MLDAYDAAPLVKRPYEDLRKGTPTCRNRILSDGVSGQKQEIAYEQSRRRINRDRHIL